MANRLISEMGLPNSIANIFAARNIKTAKDALSLTEFELMELLDVGLTEVTSALAYISEVVCPPFETALSLLEQRVQNEHLAGHLPTKLEGLDKALCGGIPFGVVTELVGPAGIGKTQFCLKLALLASLPVSCGGLDGHVIYIDVESKFSSRRMIEIGSKSFPEVFYREGMAKEMAGRILVLQPTSLLEFTDSLQQIKVLLLQNKAKLLIIDSMAALLSGEYEQTNPRQHALAWHISFIKSLAELSRIPIVVTNQVRSQSHDDSLFSFQHTDGTNLQMQTRSDNLTRFDTHLIAALGIHWAHAVSIRLILDSRSGQRYMKIAKSPMSPPLQFCFEITASGISFLSDDGVEVSGPQINAIHSHGHSDIIYCGDTC
ncbi:DNA repair protein RAD51 homolog 2-like isoform X1 [Chenopodium quinoa]|uniref:DNA repair protein RAD51 homolog 2-like isoform X1 n=1 Tax=Chenopodium quinoa TaxID=63459 RepID=UPI000B7883E8|nr:DNA repair protein RAD51 homolog 2-like isoform X1 [Chenopodium quinoa]